MFTEAENGLRFVLPNVQFAVRMPIFFSRVSNMAIESSGILPKCLVPLILFSTDIVVD